MPNQGAEELSNFPKATQPATWAVVKSGQPDLRASDCCLVALLLQRANGGGDRAQSLGAAACSPGRPRGSKGALRQGAAFTEEAGHGACLSIQQSFSRTSQTPRQLVAPQLNLLIPVVVVAG